MKRANPYSGRQRAIKRARSDSMRAARTTAYYSSMNRFPRRAYSNSMVPLRSGGYRPNNVERKVNDTGFVQYNVNTTGNFTLLANPAVGANFNERIGRKITLKSVFIRGLLTFQNAIEWNANQVSAAQLARFMLVWDTQPNGAIPAITDVLNTNEAASQLNLNNRDRFRILSDREWALGPFQTGAGTSMVAGDKCSVPFKKYKKLNLEMIFNGNSTGTIADINSGALYMLWIGSLPTGTTDLVFRGTTRVRYSDN